MGHTEVKCRMGEPRKYKPILRPPQEGKIGATEGEDKDQQLVPKTHQEAAPPPSKGQVLVQETLDPPSKQPQTPCCSTEIYSTNEAGEVVISTIKVNTDPGRRGAQLAAIVPG
ncbi:unnamed protein product [Amaranthus hypochondriacus]